jgi:hypothetical protein
MGWPTKPDTRRGAKPGQGLDSLGLDPPWPHHGPTNSPGHPRRVEDAQVGTGAPPGTRTPDPLIKRRVSECQNMPFDVRRQ